MQPFGQTSGIRREAFYFGEPSASLFGVFHVAATPGPRDCVAVICPPLGFESIHAHRTMRHLADGLARAGIPTLRFDYHGTGNSSGTDLDADRLPRWLKDIQSAVHIARQVSGISRVCLVGIRLGAALATLACAMDDVDWLALWFPVDSGRRYVREQKMVAGAAAAAGSAGDGEAAMEAAGFVMTRQTEKALSKVNLLDIAPRATEGALLLLRDDLPANQALHDHLAAHGLQVQSVACAGYAGMMAEPIDTVVADAAIDATVRWLVGCTAPLPPEPPPVATRPSTRMVHAVPAHDGDSVVLIDDVERFGPDGRLLGVVTRRQGGRPNLPAFVLLNSGVVHNVGAQRLNLLLSRRVAALGFPVLRFDIEGTGESVAARPEDENLPYPDTAMRDVGAALDHLAERHGSRQVIVAGLCSGAYHAFVAGLECRAQGIVEVMLINPPNLNWRIDGFLSEEFKQVVQYRKSVRSNDKWAKLLKGQVDLLNVARVALFYLVGAVRQRLATAHETLVPTAGGVVATQLRSLYAANRHVSLICSEDDPSRDLMLHNARVAVKRGLRRGWLTCVRIPQADHTFSTQSACADFMSKVEAHLAARYLEHPPRNS